MARPETIHILMALALTGIIFPSTSIAQSPTCATGYTVYFANGIQNDVDSAVAGMYGTENLIGPTSNNLPIHYALRFHDQNTVGNLRTVLMQKLQTDPSFSWATGSILSELVLDAVNGSPFSNVLRQFLPQSLQDKLSSLTEDSFLQVLEANGIPGNGYYDTQVGRDVEEYLKSLQLGQLVLVVAHSQGNLYVDAAYRQLFASSVNSIYQNAFAVDSVATPDVGTVSNINGAPAYLTSSNDLVIGGLHAAFPNVLKPTDGNGVFNLIAAADCFFSKSLADCRGHGFLPTYLNPDLPFRSEILSQAQALLGSLHQANASSCNKSLTYTGQTFTTAYNGGALAGPITGTIVFAKPVPPDFTGDISVPGDPIVSNPSNYVVSVTLSSSGVGQMTCTAPKVTDVGTRSMTCNEVGTIFGATTVIDNIAPITFTNGQVTGSSLFMEIYVPPSAAAFITIAQVSAASEVVYDAADFFPVNSMGGDSYASGRNDNLPGTWLPTSALPVP